MHAITLKAYLVFLGLIKEIIQSKYVEKVTACQQDVFGSVLLQDGQHVVAISFFLSSFKAVTHKLFANIEQFYLLVQQPCSMFARQKQVCSNLGDFPCVRNH